jgi:hypothetical protein
LDVYHTNATATPTPTPTTPTTPTACNGPEDAYDRMRKGMLLWAIRNEGWRSELCRYLDDIPSNVSKDTDIVDWWDVSESFEHCL